MGVGPVFSGSEKDNRDSIEMFGVYAVHIGERQNNDYCQRSQQDEEQEETKHPAKSRKKTTYEEKQTDVNIAIEMIKNVIRNKNDISILVSADSDLLPSIHLIRELEPNHKIFTYFPPNRYSVDLNLNSDVTIKLSRYEHRFRKSVLPEKVTLSNAYVLKRPDNWK